MDERAVAAVAALDDDVRRALFTFVRDAGHPVTREQAAGAVGISRKLAAFHLDKLVDIGLLEAGIGRPGRRRAGRAPKVYEPTGRDIAVCIPQREPGLLADILLATLRGELSSPRTTDAVLRTADDRGRREGAEVREQVRPGRLGAERAIRLIEGILERRGFQPVRDGTAIRLRNCPFHPLAESAPDIVCRLNHAYLSGMLRGLGAEGALQAVLDPAPGRCCVTFHPR